MEETAQQARGERCHRCLEPVPPKVARCPHCGDPLKRTANVRLILGIFGLLMFVGIALIAVRLMSTSGSRSAVSDEPEQQVDQAAPTKRPPPEKKPALGQ